ncbi:hypothetical protein WA026_010624 [Henosepilachna vigintioctopunctata]|uniref:Uncharacterized protein n=1 Tax=Henosepilachna vigintioctopunctata TaxID=420089 RepID=A0AAW1VAS6_9CUCU
MPAPRDIVYFFAAKMFKIKFHYKCIIILCSIGLWISVYKLYGIFFPPEINRETLLHQIRLDITNDNDSVLCKPPNLPVYSPELMKFILSVPPINCEEAGIDWVKCENYMCYIKDEARELYGNIQCSYTDILRLDDYENYEGSTKFGDTYHLMDSDVVKVSCISGKHKWSNILTSVHKNHTVLEQSSWEKVPKNSLNLNVLMFGLDSLSRNLFIRKLPKTYQYLTKRLKGEVLEGYNIVGDGTPQALIPMLTGKTELELPDTRKRFQSSYHVNAYPFVWNQFKNAGYVTGYLEDMPLYGVFTYRLKGFKDIPTDHYMRPYYLSEVNEQKKWPNYCTGNTPRHKVMINFIKDFFQVYQNKPKFMFGFHGELSHDNYNLVGAADHDLRQFFEDLHESNVLNTTILIVFADHGHRFAAIRNTLAGKLEERLPFFSVVLPPWFPKKYPVLYKNLRNNVKKLTTPFDVHATLKSILNPELNRDPDTNRRSYSLFSEIPSDRVCSKAFIEPHWCACLSWNNLDITLPIVPLLSQTLVDTLNNYTKPYRHLCDIWSLKTVNWASKLTPNKNLVKFKNSVDRDGFLADLSGDTKINAETYQINVELQPDGALFEASISHSLVNNKFVIRMSDISRINMYGKQAKCIEDNFPNLRKYCHCKLE